MALAVQPVTSSSLSSVVSSVSTRSSPSTIRPTINNSNRSVNTKFIVDWNSPSKTTALSNKTKTTDDNLQDAFRRFREQRMEEMRIQQRIESRKKKKIRRSNPQRMRRLRLKFVEQAKRYLGIPYAKKYFEPGTSEYESKLFLDCCGLVRRVMYDLAKDFGFTIGPWNQSYMYDTLPKTITSLSDVKPGDLVFISATYYNPKMKKQRHDLTHVEIMLGEGEKTIGARWNNGKVQFFDSYKFVSKSYHSQVYTIKSLDPWLKGICKSCCTEHPWRRRRYKKVNKNSIFFSRDQSNRGHHHRSHSSKRTSCSSTSSINSTNKKADVHRKRKHRTARSKSQKNTNSTVSSTEQIITNLNNEQLPVSSTIDIESISEDDDDEDDSIDILGNQLTKLNCQGEQEECDDSDSMDDALNAEQFDDDIESSIVTTATTTTVQS
ncbi:unnamed protein product [Adineta steineri]|uniref:NlpC/P60 domain-containing protein n=1 Tax=Adineta steineri TaxID=433720 RepID=A0A815G4A7_9BILA|nr:unnamed protein product [Adineta steineri]CAF3662106.1 unnamed protein product [Adineta steineri]CAF3898261.1 unnamed protein product [Adineta steineri]